VSDGPSYKAGWWKYWTHPPEAPDRVVTRPVRPEVGGPSGSRPQLRTEMPRGPGQGNQHQSAMPTQAEGSSTRTEQSRDVAASHDEPDAARPVGGGDTGEQLYLDHGPPERDRPCRLSRHVGRLGLGLCRAAGSGRDWQVNHSAGSPVTHLRSTLSDPAVEGPTLTQRNHHLPISSLLSSPRSNTTHHQIRLLIAAPPLALALLLAGCGPATSTPPRSTSTTPPTTGAVVKTATVSVNGTPETVLTNSAGRTLYYFTKDSPQKVACTGSCATIWPALTTSASTVAAPSGTSGTFTLFNGANGNQVEYNGHPLYTYSVDTGPDQSHGEGVLGEWYVATAAISVAASPSPTSSSGSSGY